jgi:hypothetical protein
MIVGGIGIGQELRYRLGQAVCECLADYAKS